MNKKKNNFIPKIIKFKKYYNKTGTLVPFENSNKNLKIGNNCPIKIRRIFFSTAKKNTFRGNHAHKLCSQLLICINGSIKIDTIHHYKKKKTFYISKNKNLALLIPPLVWNKIYFKKKNSYLIVICDHKYNKKDEYINSLGKFKIVSKKKFGIK